MLDEDEVSRLRALVGNQAAEPETTQHRNGSSAAINGHAPHVSSRLADSPTTSVSERDSKGNLLRLVGIGVAVIVVLASLIVSGILVWNELFSSSSDSATEPPEPVVVTPTPATEPSAGPTASPSTTSTTEPFEELRYLPAGTTDRLVLQSALTAPTAATLTGYLRIEDEKLTGAVFIDANESNFVQGPGVVAPVEATIDREPALVAGAGPLLSHVIQWTHPTFGPLRATAVGLTEF